MSTETVSQLVQDRRPAFMPRSTPFHAGRRTARNVAFNVVGNVLQAASQGVILVLLARLAGAESLGAYALGLAVAAPISMCTNASLRSLLATEREATHDFRDYLGLRLIAATMSLGLIVSIAWSGFYSPWLAGALTWVGVHKAIWSISDIVHGLYQQHERADRIAQSLAIKACGSPAIMAIVLLSGGGLLEALAAMSMFGLVVLWVFELPWARPFAAVAPRWRRTTLRALGFQAMPLGIMAACVSLAANIPRHMLAATDGTEILAQFAILAYFLQAESMIVISAQQAMGPVLARHYAAGRPKFVRTLMGTALAATAIALTAAIAAWLFGGSILAVLYGEPYTRLGGLLAAMMLATIPLNLRCFLRAGLTVMRVTRVQAPMAMGDMIVSLTFAAVLIPLWGLAGAVGTTMLTATFSVVLLGSTLIRHLRLVKEPLVA